MKLGTEVRIDDRYSYRVERCVDSPDYVWTLLCDGQDLSDGYESTSREAARKAKQAHKEHLEWVEAG